MNDDEIKKFKAEKYADDVFEDHKIEYDDGYTDEYTENYTDENSESQEEPLPSAAISKNRKISRKRGFVGYFLLMLFFVAAVIFFLSRTVLFNISEIIVTGNSFYTQDEIIDASQIELNDNLYRLKDKEAEKRIIDNLVKIDNVKFIKNKNGELTIKVSECEAANAISYIGEYLLVSQGGKIFDKTFEKPDTLIVEGFEPDDPSVGKKAFSSNVNKQRVYTELTKLLKERELDVKYMNMTDVYNIVLDYEHRITISFGGVIDAKYKLDYFENALSSGKIESGAKGKFMLRGTNIASFVPDKRGSSG